MIKNVIIFGGSGLIGNTLLNSDLLKEKHRLINLDIKNIGNREIYYKCDTSKKNQIEKSIRLIVKKYGQIYAIINVTYPKVLQKKNPGKIDSDLFSNEISAHFKSFLNTTQIMCNYYVKNKIKGKIINFASIYGEYTPRFEIYKDTNLVAPLQYLLSKNSIVTMTKYFSKFYLKKKININCISPGGIFDFQDKKFVKNYKKFCATGMLNSNDLNGITNFLLSSNSNKIFGQNMIIDDGFTL